MAAAASGHLPTDRTTYVQVDVLPDLARPQGGVPCPDDGDGSPHFVELKDTQEAYRQTVVKFLNDSGIPVHYLPSIGGMGAASGPGIPTIIKVAGMLPQVARWVNGRIARARRTKRQSLLVEYLIQIKLNWTHNTVMPTLGCLPELIEKLESDYPSIRPSVYIDATEATHGPCTIHFGAGSVTDHSVLVVTDWVRKHEHSSVMLVGCRRRYGLEIKPWRVRATYDGEEMWAFIHPGKMLNPLLKLGRVPTKGLLDSPRE